MSHTSICLRYFIWSNSIHSSILPDSFNIKSGPSLLLQVSMKLLARVPHPPTHESTEAVTAKKKEKHLLKNHASPLQSCQTVSLAALQCSNCLLLLNFALDLLLLKYLRHCFLILESSFFIATHYSFHLDDLRVNTFNAVLYRIPLTEKTNMKNKLH